MVDVTNIIIISILVLLLILVVCNKSKCFKHAHHCDSEIYSIDVKNIYNRRKELNDKNKKVLNQMTMMLGGKTDEYDKYKHN